MLHQMVTKDEPWGTKLNEEILAEMKQKKSPFLSNGESNPF